MRTPDPRLRQELLDTLHKKYDDAFNSNDAAAVAAFFAEDAVIVPPETGPVYGRKAIEKHYADLFKEYHISDHVGKPDQYSPHDIGVDGKLWSNGDWSLTLKTQTGDSMQLKGYWAEVLVREGDAWKAQMLIWNMTPEPGPPA